MCIPVAILLVVYGAVQWKIGEEKKAARAAGPPKSVDDGMEHYTARVPDDAIAVTPGKSSQVDDDFYDSNNNAPRPVSRTSVV